MDIDDDDGMDIYREMNEGEITNLPPWPYAFSYEVCYSSGVINIIIGPPPTHGLPSPLRRQLASMFAAKGSGQANRLKLGFHLRRGQYNTIEGFKCLIVTLAWSLAAFKGQIASVDIDIPQEVDAHARSSPLRNLDFSWVPAWTYRIFQ